MAEEFDEWVVVELLGRTCRAGRLTERVIAGHGFLRLEVPDGDGWVTQFIGPAAVYAITPVTEDVARAAAANWRPEPVNRWELRELVRPDPTPDYGDEGPF